MYVTSLLLLAVALASSSDVSLPPIHLDEASKPSYWPKLWQNITQTKEFIKCAEQVKSRNIFVGDQIEDPEPIVVFKKATTDCMYPQLRTRVLYPLLHHLNVSDSFATSTRCSGRETNEVRKLKRLLTDATTNVDDTFCAHWHNTIVPLYCKLDHFCEGETFQLQQDFAAVYAAQLWLRDTKPFYRCKGNKTSTLEDTNYTRPHIRIFKANWDFNYTGFNIWENGFDCSNIDYSINTRLTDDDDDIKVEYDDVYRSKTRYQHSVVTVDSNSTCDDNKDIKIEVLIRLPAKRDIV